MSRQARFTIIEAASITVPRCEQLEIAPGEDPMEPCKIPCYVVLIQHPDLGYVLLDTGVNVNWKTRWPHEMTERYEIFHVWNLKDKLKEMNLTIDDIDQVILSHMHYDHSGNVRMFCNSRAGQNIMAYEEDLARAFMETCKYDVGDKAYHYNGFLREEFNGIPGISYQTITEDTRLAEGFELIVLPGHTPGVLCIVLETEENGTVIFPQDAIGNTLNYGPPVNVPDTCRMPEEYKASIERVRRIAEERHARVFFSHDQKLFDTWKKSPEWYE